MLREYLKKFRFVFQQLFISSPAVLFLTIGTMIVDGASPIITTYLISLTINTLEMNVNKFTINIFMKVLILLISALILTALSFSIQNISSTLSQISGSRLAHNMENIVADKFQRISQKELDSTDFLDLYKNTCDKCGYEPLNFMESLLGIMSSFISLLGYSYVLIKFSFVGFLLILLFSVPALLYRWKNQGHLYKFLTRSTNKLRGIWYHFSLMSDPAYAKEVRILGLYNYLKHKRNKLFGEFIKENDVYAKKDIKSAVFSYCFMILGAFLMEIMLVKKVLTSVVTISDFYLYTTAIIALEMKLMSNISVLVNNNKSMLFLEYLFKFLNLEEEVKFIEDKKIKIPNKVEDIEFVNVSFKYSDNSDWVLRNINLKIRINEKICLVGENGSGKTTLIKLLLRIYYPTDGEILLNGHNIRQYDIVDFRKLMGIMFQDYINYSVKVRDCIGFGNIDEIDNITNIKSAAQITGANNFITKFDKGYETNLSRMFDDCGIEPSIGQWQRLAMARAVFTDSPILILDEPTASLDPKAEEEIFNIFNLLGENKITVLISHRMSSAKLADKIIVLEKGQIVETGTHDELMKREGLYYEMYTLQAQKYS